MTIKFTVAIPDEPYTQSFTQNKSIEITYTGPNFLVITYDANNNRVQAADGYFNNESDIDLSNFADDKFQFAVVNAANHTLECAIITDYYEHETIDPYTETIPTGEEFVFNYAVNGILDDLFTRWELRYYPETNSFSTLDYKSFPTSKEQFLDSLTNHINLMTVQKQIETENDADADRLAKIDQIISWCENFQTVYPNTDHWKIPFPVLD
jgi:hypothetical protein